MQKLGKAQSLQYKKQRFVVKTHTVTKRNLKRPIVRYTTTLQLCRGREAVTTLNDSNCPSRGMFPGLK